MKQFLPQSALLLIVIFVGFNTKMISAQTMASNPFIWADVPDVCVVRVGNTYYMSSTTMHMSPGVPIMKSTDLVNWQIVSYCYSILASTDALNLANGKNAYGGGSWASSIVYNNGTYYVSTASQTTNTTYIFKTTNIETGTWTVSTLSGYYHDQSLFFDDDGRVFMIYGSNNISILELTSDASAIKAGGLNQVLVPNASSIAGTSFIVSAEGSHFQKINGIYYLSNICWPNGSGRTQLLYMCSTLTGSYQGKVVLNYNGIAQGGFIDTPSGGWYAMLFQDNGSVGRSPDLVPVTWTNNWPTLGTNGTVPTTLNIPIGTGISGIVSSDEFSVPPPLKLDWQWNHNPNNNYWSLIQRSGYLRLTNERTDPNITQTTNTLTQRTFGPTCSGYVAMDVTGMVDGDYAGLTAFQADYGFVGVKMTGATKTIVMVNAASGTPTEVTDIPLTQTTVYLRIDMNFLNKTDKANFYYSLNGTTWQSIGNTLQMSYTIPQFIGYRYGLFSYATKSAGGYVDFDFFRIGATIIAAQNSQSTCATVAPTVTSPVTYCQGSTATALSATGSSLLWYTTSTGGTGVTTAPTPNTSTAGTTDYYVSQTITGCESPRAAIAVTVNALPVITPYVQLNGNWLQQNTATVCAGATISIGPQPVATTGWTWTGPSNYTSTARQITLTNLTTMQGGVYTSNYTDANGCKASSAFTVTVNALPNVPTVVSPITYCQNATATALSATGTNLNWYTTATGGTASTISPTPNTATAGTTSYYVSQTANGCEGARATIAVTVNALPTASVTASGATTFCSGGSVILNVNSGTGLTYQWSNGGTTISGANGSSYTASASGSYTVAVTNSTACKTSSEATIITVDNEPSVSNAGIDQYITSTTTNLSANIPLIGTGKWSVVSGTGTFSNGSSASTVVTGLSSGANVLKWAISNGSCPASNSTLTIHVGTDPTTQTITGPNNINSNQKGLVYSIPDNIGSSYHWTLPVGATITSANTDSSQITVSFGSTGGTLIVTETNVYGKAVSSLNVNVMITTGITMGVNTTTCEVRPNPFSDNTTILIHSTMNERISLMVLNIQGVICYSSSEYFTNQEFTVGSELTADGVYFVQLAFDDQVKIIKLIKMR